MSGLVALSNDIGEFLDGKIYRMRDYPRDSQNNSIYPTVLNSKTCCARELAIGMRTFAVLVFAFIFE
jgi:hypothetical protein